MINFQLNELIYFLSFSLIFTIYLTLCFNSVGYYFIKIFGEKNRIFNLNNIFYGMMVYGIFLIIQNFFFKINFFFLILLFFFLFSFILNNLKLLGKMIIGYKSHIIFFLIFILYLNYFALTNWFAADTDYYHLQKIKIINSEPIVFGLANLERTYGFVNLNHYLSALTIGKDYMRLFYIPSVIIFTITFLKIISIYKDDKKKDFCIIILTGLIYMNFRSIGSSAPDFFVNCSVLFILSNLFLLKKNSKKIEYKIILYSIPFLPLIKLSSIFFSFVLFVILIAKNEKKNLGILLFFVSFLVYLFINTNFVLSGFLLYPFPKIYIPTEWSLTVEQVEIWKNIIISWAKMPGPNYINVIEGGDWFKKWIINLDKFILIFFLFSLVLLLFFSKKNIITPFLLVKIFFIYLFFHQLYFGFYRHQIHDSLLVYFLYYLVYVLDTYL